MSALSAVGSTNQSQMMQQLLKQAQGTRTQPTPPPQFQAQLQTAVQAAGLDASTIANIQGDIQSAIKTALSGLDGSTNPREAVSSAVKEVFEKYGIDPQDFKSKMAEALGQSAPSLSRPDLALSSIYGAEKSSQSSEPDLLATLLEHLESTKNESIDDSEDDAFSMVQFLQNLPAGSLINTLA